MLACYQNLVGSGVSNPTSGATGTAQNGVSRLWRLTFDDISNPTAGGSIDLVINGVKNNTKVQMLDNMCVADDGNIFLTEDPGNSTYIAKTWIYDPIKDTLVQLVKFDPARWGDLAINGGTPGAFAPHTNDKEISGVIDVTSFLPGMPGETVLLLAVLLQWPPAAASMQALGGDCAAGHGAVLAGPVGGVHAAGHHLQAAGGCEHAGIWRRLCW